MLSTSTTVYGTHLKPAQLEQRLDDVPVSLGEPGVVDADAEREGVLQRLVPVVHVEQRTREDIHAAEKCVHSRHRKRTAQGAPGEKSREGKSRASEACLARGYHTSHARLRYRQLTSLPLAVTSEQ